MSEHCTDVNKISVFEKNENHICNKSGLQCGSGRNQCNQERVGCIGGCKEQGSCGGIWCGQQLCGIDMEEIIERINKAILLSRSNIT